MATSCVYEHDKDRNQHARAIQMLAEELSIPEVEIQILYETMLCSLKERARVKDYLAILVCRNVKAMITGDISLWKSLRQPNSVEIIKDEYAI